MNDMFDIVRRYSERPHHRTGTDNDRATIEWLAEVSRNRGAQVTIDRWSFPQWTAEWSAELDGTAIDAFPMFYETTESNTIYVVATPHPNGRLAVVNRRPVAEPVLHRSVNVSGRYADRVDDVVAHIDNVRIIDGTSANVRARWQGKGPTVLIATPISGWFNCASERGCGIAIALHLTDTFIAEGRSVELLFTSGHELFNLGLTHELAKRTSANEVQAIVHVGASVAAAGSGPRGLSEQLFVTSNVADCGVRLASLGYAQRVGGSDIKDWIGEARQWKTLDVPLLSISGASEWFHTPDDVAETATSPELLAMVAESLVEDVREFLQRSPHSRVG
jgi:hypothetical protein